jgi:hypothetical protein
MTASEMHSRAILVSLRISAWSARKYDRKVTNETNQAHGADADAGRYNKNLLPGDAPSYKALTQHITAMRAQHTAQTLAWSDDGWRLLPVRNFQKYMDMVRQGQHTFDRLLEEFWRDYPTLRAQAKDRLNGMYLDADYPRDIRDRFSFAMEPAPVPAATDYRVALTQDEINTIATRTEERVKQAFADAQKDAVQRLYKCVSHIHERLTAVRVTKDRATKARTLKKDHYDKVTGELIPAGTVIPGRAIAGGQVKNATFRDTLVDNARELCEILRYINLADDPKLEEFRRQTELIAGSTEAETLRDSDAVRKDTANRAQSILDAMAATYGAAVQA